LYIVEKIPGKGSKKQAGKQRHAPRDANMRRVYSILPALARFPVSISVSTRAFIGQQEHTATAVDPGFPS
jgi:hypothetical protein